MISYIISIVYFLYIVNATTAVPAILPSRVLNLANWSLSSVTDMVTLSQLVVSYPALANYGNTTSFYGNSLNAVVFRIASTTKCSSLIQPLRVEL